MKRRQKDPNSSRRKPPVVDPEKLHAALRGLDRDGLLEVLDRALELIPRARLAEVAGARISPEDLAPDSDFLGQVAKFCAASRRGDFKPWPWRTLAVSSLGRWAARSCSDRPRSPPYNAPIRSRDLRRFRGILYSEMVGRYSGGS